MTAEDRFKRFEDVPSEKVHHVFPNFGRAHITDQRDQCWCFPYIYMLAYGAIIIHQAEH